MARAMRREAGRGYDPAMIRPVAASILAAVATLLAACGDGGTSPAARADATPVRATFTVEGMHCNGCAEAIVDELKETPGVRSATCSFETKTCEVELQPSTSPETAAGAIRKLGYTVSAAAPADSK